MNMKRIYERRFIFMKNLKCYIVKDNKSKEDYYNKFSDWEGEYVQNGELVHRKYKDPDTEESRSYEFYEKLTKFLNIQENSSKYQLKGKYTYKFNYTNPYGIEVREKSNDPRDKNKEIESGPIFYLKSDQFGFSRPSKEHKHPYDSYLEKSSYSETSKKNVAKWLYETRRLGGSFLWPMEQKTCGIWDSNPEYNIRRGGTKFRKGGSYIEDRVDLTLLEIKQVMDYIGFDHQELEGNILWNCCLPEPNMIKWLRHFGNFETYVKFFCFEDFVEKKSKNGHTLYRPIDIVKSNLNKNKKKDNKVTIDEDYYSRKERSDFSIYDKGHKDMETMFNNVNILITRRTKTMEKK